MIKIKQIREILKKYNYKVVDVQTIRDDEGNNSYFIIAMNNHQAYAIYISNTIKYATKQMLSELSIHKSYDISDWFFKIAS